MAVIAGGFRLQGIARDSRADRAFGDLGLGPDLVGGDTGVSPINQTHGRRASSTSLWADSIRSTPPADETPKTYPPGYGGRSETRSRPPSRSTISMDRSTSARTRTADRTSPTPTRATDESSGGRVQDARDKIETQARELDEYTPPGAATAPSVDPSERGIMPPTGGIKILPLAAGAGALALILWKVL